jgi:hypothetical protein
VRKGHRGTVFAHLDWVDVPRWRCSWSVSVGGGGGVVGVVPLWGLASRAFVVLRIAVDVAHRWRATSAVWWWRSLWGTTTVAVLHRCGCGRRRRLKRLCVGRGR